MPFGGGVYKNISVVLEASTAGYVGGMAKAQKATADFAKEAATAKVAAEAGPATTKWDGFVNRTSQLGSSMSKNVTLPILAFAGVAVAAFEQVDHAYHTIEQRTGATGAALKGLKSDFDAVASTTGANFQHVADVMSQLNQRLGLAGKPLQDMTRQFVTLERVAGAGAPTVDQVTKAMVAWGVATGNQSTELDKLFVASQKTGVPLNTLIDDVTRFAPVMKTFGFSMDESTAILGSFEKAGIPASRAMMALNVEFKNAAAAGVAPKQALAGVIGELERLVKLGGPENLAKANEIALKAFGTRGAALFLQAVKDGRLGYQALLDLMNKGAGEIAKVGAATLPLSVQLGMLKNQAILALAPIGEVLLPKIQGALKDIIPIIRDVVGGFAALPPVVQNVGLGALAATAALGPLLKLFTWIVGGATAAAGAVVSFGSALTTVGLEVAAFAESAVVAFGSVAAAAAAATVVIAAVVAVGAGLKTTWDSYSANAHEAANVTKFLSAQVQSTGKTLHDVFSQNLTGTFLGKSLGKGGLLDAQNAGIFAKDMQDIGVSAQEVARHIGDGQKQWEQFRNALVARSYDKDKFILNETARGLDDLRRGWIGATKDLAPYLAKLDQQQRGLVASALAGEAASVSTKKLTADTETLAKVAADPAYMKLLSATHVSLVQVVGDAQKLGLSVQDAFGKNRWDPAAIEAAVKALDAFTQKVSDTITTAGNITSVTAGQLKLGGAGIVAFYQDQIKENDKFTKGLMEATRRGLDPTVITQLMTAGPAKANPILANLLRDTGGTLIKQVNVFSKEIEHQSAIAAIQARILFLATQGPHGGEAAIRDMALADQIAFKTNLGANQMTDDELAKALHTDPATIHRIAAEFNLTVAKQPPPTLAPPKPPDFTRVLNDYKSLDRSTSSIVAKGVADIASQFGAANADLSASQAKLRDTLIRHWVETHGGTARQAQAMIDQIDGITSDGRRSQEQRAKALRDAYIKWWADTHHVSVAEATRMIVELEHKQDAHDAAMRVKWALAADNARIAGLRIGQGMVDGINSQGLNVQSAALGYVRNITGALNPVLAGLGLHEISVSTGAGHKAFNRGGLIDGGQVPGSGPDEDSVHAYLTPREFVVRRKVVDDIGADSFHALNQGRATIVPFNQGGLTPAQIAAGRAYGDQQAGKPYVWGGVGPGGFDCSGLASSIIDVIVGQNPRTRLFTSASLVGGGAGLSPGLGQVAVGAENRGGSGHVAMTISGKNYEATPPAVRVGGGARGADDPMFTAHFHLGSGSFISGGGGGFGGSLQLPRPPHLTGRPWLDRVAQGGMDHTYLLAQQWADAHTQNNVGDPAGGGVGLGAALGPVTGGLIARIEAVIRSIESGGSYTARNPSSSASGAYQFLNSTWAGLGGHGGSAASASPAEQDAVAGAYISRILASNGGAVQSVPATWYVGHYDPGNLDYVPGGGNRLTVRQYIDMWMGRFGQTAPTPGAAGHRAFNTGGMVEATAGPKRRAGTVTRQNLEDAYMAYHPHQRSSLATTAAQLYDQFPNGRIGDFDQDGTMTPAEWHAWKDRKQRTTIRGWNWKDMQPLAGPPKEAIRLGFPTGLIGDTNRDRKVSDQEWSDWLLLRKDLEGPHALKALQFLQDVARNQHRRHHNTGGMVEPAKSFDTPTLLESGWNRMYNGTGRPELLHPQPNHTTHGARNTVNTTLNVTVNSRGDVDVEAKVQRAIEKFPQKIVDALARHEATYS